MIHQEINTLPTVFLLSKVLQKVTPKTQTHQL